MRCLIVDDEKLARVELQGLLSRFPEVEVIGEADAVDAAVELTERLRPDVVFLDIQLRGETGFDLLARAPEPLPEIVFVTAHDSHAIRAFECNALDYLLKPVHPDRLAVTLQRLAQRQALERRPAEEGDSFFLKVGTVARFIPWREVEYIVSDGNYTQLHFRESPSVHILRTLKEWSALTPEGMFLQVHRTVLVRRDAIREIRFSGPRRARLLLASGSLVPVGRSYVAAVRSLLAA